MSNMAVSMTRWRSDVYMINMTSMKRKGAIHDVPAEAKVLAICNVYVQEVVVEASLGNVVDANAHVRAKTLRAAKSAEVCL